MANPTEIPSMLKGLFLNHHFYCVFLMKSIMVLRISTCGFQQKTPMLAKVFTVFTGRRNAIKQFQIKQKSKNFFREMHILFNPPFN